MSLDILTKILNHQQDIFLNIISYLSAKDVGRLMQTNSHFGSPLPIWKTLVNTHFGNFVSLGRQTKEVFWNSRLETPEQIYKILHKIRWDLISRVTGRKRIILELKEILLDPIEGISFLEAIGDNIMIWRVAVHLTQRPYIGRTLNVKITFNEEYPFKPPRMMLEQGIFHPNFTLTGEFCDHNSGELWSPDKRAINWLATRIAFLLVRPSQDTGHCVHQKHLMDLYQTNREEYFRTVEERMNTLTPITTGENY